MTSNLNKVAEITIYFWIMKILATTLGETSGDMFSMTLGAGYLTTLIITGIVLLGLITSQVRSARFHPALYWAAIVGTTTVGTEVSDFMDRTLGLGYLVGSLILSTGLVGTLTLWYAKEKSLTVYPITRKTPEAFYWLAIFQIV